MKNSKQMSESLFVALLITFSGGLQDAYTYFARDHVFANAQTGNIALMASKIADGHLLESLRYLAPLFAFAFGIFITEQIQGRFKQAQHLHWRQFVLLLEIIVLFLAGWIPSSINFVANSLISFSCAMQVQAFRSTHGYPYASTMCIGNIRAGVSAFSHWCRTKNHQSLTKAGHYLLVILIFAAGAATGYNSVATIGLPTIWVSSLLLLVAFCLMFKTEENRF